MKVKYLLTALALPAMFAACSQEDIVTDVQNQQTELLGKVAGDVDFILAPQSRLTWDADNKVAWETEDGFSMFWVGNLNGVADDELDGKSNALYKKNGDKFTSQSIVYEGNHIIVYPADYAHLSDKAIEVSVGALQYDSIALGKRSVWTTDSLLTIMSPVEDEDDIEPGVIYAGGYGEAVPATLQALSSNLVMNLHFAMGNATSVTVKKVVLKSNNNVFSVNGKLAAVAKAATKYNQDVTFVDGTPVNEVTLSMAKNTSVTTADTTYTVQFSLLPLITQTALTDATYSIEVHTNYGIVTINEAKNVLARSGSVFCNSVSTAVDAEGGIPAANKALDLTDEIKLMAQHNVKDYLYRTTEKKANLTAYGKKIELDVNVNMSDASITGMEVANSEELIDAYATYTLLGKKGNENFVLTTSPFELTPEAVTAILGNNKITLEFEDNAADDTVKFVGNHTSLPSFNIIGEAPALTSAITGIANTTLVLGAEGTWALDVDKAAEYNAWAKVVNVGNLTISESNPATGAVALSKAIENQGNVTISGTVTIPTKYTQTAGKTDIPADAKWVAAEGQAGFEAVIQGDKASLMSDISAGEVNVTGYWSVENDNAIVNIKDGAIVNVTGIVNTTKGEFLNEGVINIKDENAVVVITRNHLVESLMNGMIQINSKDKGEIFLTARNNYVNVTNANCQGYIKWNCDVDTFEAKDGDTFNYAILSKNLTVKKQGTLKHVEITGGRVDLSETVEEALSLDFVKVNKGATLMIPTGSDVTYKTYLNEGNKEIILGSFVNN